MPASYPAAVKSFSAITAGATVIEQSHFDDLILEIEAVEAELDVGVIGSAGSLVDRLKLAFDPDGEMQGHTKVFNATATQRLRMRCGVTAVECDSLTISSPTWSRLGTITWDVPLVNDCIAFLNLQLIESDPSLDTIPAFVNYIRASGTTTSFDYLVSTHLNRAPAAGTSFLLHWVAIEETCALNSGTLPL